MYKPVKNWSLEDALSTTDEKLLKEKNGSSTSFEVEDGSKLPTKRTWLDLSRPALLFHLSLIALYTVYFVFFVHRSAKQGPQRPKLIYSPGSYVIEMERKMLHAPFEGKNPFRGPPSDELDHAWHTLFVNANIRVSAEDLRKINRTSVPLADAKGGYYAIPDVYHQLHCLVWFCESLFAFDFDFKSRQKFLRQVIYADYYHLEDPTTPVHIDHCIENLRQNIMCKGDVSLLTFEWMPKERAPKPNFDIEHDCVNWDTLDNWAESQRFDIFDEKSLVHPDLGPSYPTNKFKNTGAFPEQPENRPNQHNNEN